MYSKQRGMCSKQKGVVAIEFMLGFLVYFSMIAFWIDACYIGYISAMVDYTIAEASRESKSKSKDDYKALFQSVVNRNGSIWSSFVDVNKFSVKTRYYDSVSELVVPCSTDGNGECTEVGNPNDSALAVYTIKYDHSSIYAFFENNKKTLAISREIFTIQEYERTKFNG